MRIHTVSPRGGPRTRFYMLYYYQAIIARVWKYVHAYVSASARHNFRRDLLRLTAIMCMHSAYSAQGMYELLFLFFFSSFSVRLAL